MLVGLLTGDSMKKVIVATLVVGAAIASVLMPTGSLQVGVISLVFFALLSAVALPFFAFAWGMLYRSFLKPIEARLGGRGLQLFKLVFSMPNKS